jgi:DNA primase
VAFDLDPKGAPFSNVLKVARLMKQVLDELEVLTLVKTSGSSGIHIFVPIKRRYSFEQAMDWAEQVALTVAARFKLTDFTLATMPVRIERLGDLWAKLLRTRQTLPSLG